MAENKGKTIRIEEIYHGNASPFHERMSQAYGESGRVVNYVGA